MHVRSDRKTLDSAVHGSDMGLCGTKGVRTTLNQLKRRGFSRVYIYFGFFHGHIFQGIRFHGYVTRRRLIVRKGARLMLGGNMYQRPKVGLKPATENPNKDYFCLSLSLSPLSTCIYRFAALW